MVEHCITAFNTYDSKKNTLICVRIYDVMEAGSSLITMSYNM